MILDYSSFLLTCERQNYTNDFNWNNNTRFRQLFSLSQSLFINHQRFAETLPYTSSQQAYIYSPRWRILNIIRMSTGLLLIVIVFLVQKYWLEQPSRNKVTILIYCIHTNQNNWLCFALMKLFIGKHKISRQLKY